MARLSILLLGVAAAVLLAPASTARFKSTSVLGSWTGAAGAVMEPTDLAFAQSRTALQAANLRAKIQQLAAKATQAVLQNIPAAVPDMTRRSLLQLDPVGADPVGADIVGSDPVGSDTVGSDPYGSDTVGSDTVGSDPYGSDTVGSDPCGNGGCYGGGYGGYGSYGGYYGGEAPARRRLLDIDSWEIMEA